MHFLQEKLFIAEEKLAQKKMEIAISLGWPYDSPFFTLKKTHTSKWKN
jgi:hypothetical protein